MGLFSKYLLYCVLLIQDPLLSCSLAFGTLYPAYASYKAVKTKNVKEYVSKGLCFVNRTSSFS